MSDDDLRAALAVYAAEVKPEEYEHLPDHEKNRFKALHHMFTRLLKLLPPADDGEWVTADRVEKMGVVLYDHGGDYRFADLRTSWSVIGNQNGSHVELSLMFRDDGSLAACDMETTVYGDDGKEDVTDIELTMPIPKTMGEFRRLCDTLGIQLKGGA